MVENDKIWWQFWTKILDLFRALHFPGKPQSGKTEVSVSGTWKSLGIVTHPNTSVWSPWWLYNVYLVTISGCICVGVAWFHYWWLPLLWLSLVTPNAPNNSSLWRPEPTRLGLPNILKVPRKFCLGQLDPGPNYSKPNCLPPKVTFISHS